MPYAISWVRVKISGRLRLGNRQRPGASRQGARHPSAALAVLDCVMEETQDLHDAGSEDVEVRCHARTSAGRVPAERCLHTCTLLVQNGSRVVYLYAGRGKSGALDDLHQLDLEGNVWTQPKVTDPIPIPIIRIAIATP